METVEKTLKFLDNLSIREGAIISLQDRMKRSKQRINDVLQLNEGNQFRRIIEYNITEEMFMRVYPNTYDYILKQANGNEFSITENWIKDPRKRKLSRFLGKCINNTSIEERANRISLNSEIRNGDISVIFDIIKPKSIVISTNMYDFFTSATNASFRSCYALDGSHFNGNISYMTDSWTFMIFTYSDDIDRKIGRLWGYLLNIEQPMFLTSKIYGSMYETELGTAIHDISKSISPDAIWKVNQFDYDRYSNASPGTEYPVPVYFDYDTISIHHTQPKLKYNNLPHLEFMNIKCMRCGTNTNNGFYGMCSNCASEVIKCNLCNNVFHIENIASGTDVCQECCDKHYSECGICGEKHNTKYLVEIDGKLICKNCLYNTHRKCSLCNVWHKMEDTTVIGHLFFCKECKDSVYTCDRCGNMALVKEDGSHLKHDNMELCSGCYSQIVDSNIHIIGKQFDFCYCQYYGRVNAEISNRCETISYIFTCRNNFDDSLTFHETIPLSAIYESSPHLGTDDLPYALREIVEQYLRAKLDSYNEANGLNRESVRESAPTPPQYNGRIRSRFYIPQPEQPQSVEIETDYNDSEAYDDWGNATHSTLRTRLNDLRGTDMWVTSTDRVPRVDPVLRGIVDDNVTTSVDVETVSLDEIPYTIEAVNVGEVVANNRVRMRVSGDVADGTAVYRDVNGYHIGNYINQYQSYVTGNWGTTTSAVVAEEYPF